VSPPITDAFSAYIQLGAYVGFGSSRARCAGPPSNPS